MNSNSDYDIYLKQSEHRLLVSIGLVALIFSIKLTGGSMPLFLVIINSNMTFSQILSREIISMEIIRSLCGSIGLILTIPLTSFIASSMVLAKRRR